MAPDRSSVERCSRYRRRPSDLPALANGDLHGYAIILEIAARTDGAVRLSAGTLDRSIQRSPDSPVQRARAQADGAVRARGDLQNDGVAVEVAIRERQQNAKGRRR